MQNVWTNLILAKLVELDPAQYLGDLPREKAIITTDVSWRTSEDFNMDWVGVEFDDSQWGEASVVQLPLDMMFPGFDTLDTAPASIWLFTSVQEPDTLGLPENVMDQPIGEEIQTVPLDTSKQRRSLELEDKELLEDEIFTESPVTPDSTMAPITSTAFDTSLLVTQSHLDPGAMIYGF